MYGIMDPGRESGLGSDTDNMAELAALLNTEIPDGQNNLRDSYTNLERVADYCEGNYFQAENKRYALEETKNYTTQSLASVAYQINTLAYNFLQLLDLQANQLDEMEAQMNHIQQTVMIHKEKVARREIGVLTANKTTNRQYKIIAPANPEKPIKYVRKPIDFNALDDIGHGVRSHTPRAIKSRTSSQSSMVISGVGPAPTTKPPTPPSVVRSTGTLSKGSREYRTPPAVAPPQVPSHYAPNYPMGHGRRQGAGYSTLPLASNPAHLTQQPNTPPPPPPSNTVATASYNMDHHVSMPPPPSPLTLAHGSAEPIDPRGGMMTLPPHVARASPPLPPPPAPIDHPPPPVFAPMPIVSDELDLPGWVPKNYIEKVVAIYDYYADKEDELSFQESAVIYVLKKNDDGWWEGVMDGITGLFPGNYVEPCV
ncbi:Abl-interactor HHR [Nesidiocoris tenuis]|uniref:Abl-interactor HHR n=1 Tax=Nesidiocoris tenuis TaxID=355587 RepID=A0ABN7ASR9_9HEMI|nr:Abl-interactor HHR [Nesidiocoris tenuis]